MPEVPLPARDEALADAQDNGDVLLLDAMELHDSDDPDALCEALLVEVSLSDLKEEGGHPLLSLGLEAFKVCLDLAFVQPGRPSFMFGFGLGGITIPKPNN